jgi:plastocyanin
LHRLTRAVLASALLAVAFVALPAASAATVTVHVANYSYSAIAPISTGDTVHWSWTSGTHTVTQGACTSATCTAASGGFDVPIDSGHTTFDMQFDNAGVVKYFCKIHTTAMQGSVTVKSATTTAYTGPLVAAVGETLRLTAKVTSGASPVPNVFVEFDLAGQKTSVLTDGTGLASGSLPISGETGTRPLKTKFAGTSVRGPSEVDSTVTVSNEYFKVSNVAPAAPKSGDELTYDVTATTKPADTADLLYTGTPTPHVWSDGHATPGTCTAALAGKASCSVTLRDLSDVGVAAAATMIGAYDDTGSIAERSAAIAVGAKSLAIDPVAYLDRNNSNVVNVPVRAVGDGAAATDGYTGTVTVHAVKGATTADSAPYVCNGRVCYVPVTLPAGAAGAGTWTFSASDAAGAVAPVQDVVVRERTTLTLTTLPTSVTAGSALPIVGVLRDESGAPLVDQPVELLVRRYYMSRPLFSTAAQSEANGQVHFTARPTYNTTYYLRYAGSATRASYGPIGRATTVRPKVYISVADKSLTTTQNLTVTGYSSPLKPGTAVSLMRRFTDGHNGALKTVTIGSNGKFTLTRVFSTKGTYSLFVHIRETTSNGYGRSSLFTITVS